MHTSRIYERTPSLDLSIVWRMGLIKKSLIHSQNSRASFCAHSTEQSDLMALYLAFRLLEDTNRLVYSILDRSIPVVSFLDCDTLWVNLMNKTVKTIQEVGYRDREAITDKHVHSMFLITGTLNPMDAFTSAKRNNVLHDTVYTNRLRTTPKRVFMLQYCPFRHCP